MIAYSDMVIKLEDNAQIEGANMAVVVDEKRRIPENLIDDILSRLPVKSLIRFQTLSKSHRSTISDPWFSKINYIHQSTKSDNLFLLLTDEVEILRQAWMETEGARIGFDLVRLEGENLETVTELGNPFGAAAIPLCCCNGVVLLALKWPGEGLVLWNPSIRRHAPELISFLRKGIGSSLHFGLYDDPRADDYKVVVVSRKYNLVFSCKTATWVKEEPISPLFKKLKHGVFVDGCFCYWVGESEVACFDFREGELGKLRMPDMEADSNATLTATKGRLCVYCFSRVGTKLRVWVMQKPNCGWTELNNLERTGPHFFVAGQFRIGTFVSVAGSEFIKYNHVEKRFFIHKDFSDDVPAIHLMPYSESLVFPFLPRN